VSAEYHAWYSLPVWTERLRPEQLLREPFCAECAKAGKRTPATVVDHVLPHRGDWALFVDESNLQSLCKYHHDQKTALEMARDRHEKRSV
jgi:5-methylcytosine-specific restriction protein A